MLYYCILGLFSNCSPQSQARWPKASRHIKSGTRNDLPDEIFVVIIVVIITIRSLFNGQL